VNSFPCGTATIYKPQRSLTSGVCFLKRLDDRWCAMNKETLVEVMFAIGSSAALAAVAAFVMMFVR